VYDPRQTAASKSDYHTLVVRVRTNLHKAVERIAKSEGETVSGTVRDLIRRGLETRQASK